MTIICHVNELLTRHIYHPLIINILHVIYVQYSTVYNHTCALWALNIKNCINGAVSDGGGNQFCLCFHFVTDVFFLTSNASIIIDLRTERNISEMCCISLLSSGLWRNVVLLFQVLGSADCLLLVMLAVDLMTLSQFV